MNPRRLAQRGLNNATLQPEQEFPFGVGRIQRLLRRRTTDRAVFLLFGLIQLVVEFPENLLAVRLTPGLRSQEESFQRSQVTDCICLVAKSQVEPMLTGKQPRSDWR